jgi:signal transduction histidine kinase
MAYDGLWSMAALHASVTRSRSAVAGWCDGEPAGVCWGTMMDRRKGIGRRRADVARGAYDLLAVRSLLHDVGHQMTTLSHLVEAVRGEVDLPREARSRMEVLALEMSRLIDTIARELSVTPSAAELSTVDLRPLIFQMVHLAKVRHPASMVLLPGPDVTLEANPTLLWRVLSNVIDNAARAAGPEGRVEIGLRDQRGAAIDVTDDGPGFGLGPPGTSSLGLSVVTSLLESCGGSLEVQSRRLGGTRISIRVPAPRSCEGEKRAGGTS